MTHAADESREVDHYCQENSLKPEDRTLPSRITGEGIFIRASIIIATPHLRDIYSQAKKRAHLGGLFCVIVRLVFDLRDLPHPNGSEFFLQN